MKTMIALALAGATLAATGGALATPGTANAELANTQLKVTVSPQISRKRLVRRCIWPRTHARWEWVKVRQAGYRNVRYLGTKVFLPRCAKFYYFAACQGIKRYKIIVRYIRFSRYVIVLRNGYCLRRIHPRALKS
jgi:hypothetical protein